MSNYPPNEIVDILLILGECHRNYKLAARVYAQRYPDRRHPADRQIRNIEIRSRRNLLHRQRQRNRLQNNNNPRVLTILGLIHNNPHISIRQAQNQIGIPRATIHRILQSVRYRPYHITLVQELNANDHRMRAQFCRWTLDILDQDPEFFWNVLFGDEAAFHSNGCLNRHNCHYWSPVNPHWYRQVLYQHRWTLHVWVGICHGEIIGPHFFEHTISGASYLQFLHDHLPEYLENIPLNIRQRCWFQQDGAPAHFHHNVRTFLDEHYSNRWIGRGGPVLWPSRSPDLNPLDFFFWGYAKNIVYENAPSTRLDMMNRIKKVCEAITPEILRSVLENFKTRLRLCLRNNGGHFEHLIRRPE